MYNFYGKNKLTSRMKRDDKVQRNAARHLQDSDIRVKRLGLDDNQTYILWHWRKGCMTMYLELESDNGSLFDEYMESITYKN